MKIIYIKLIFSLYHYGVINYMYIMYMYCTSIHVHLLCTCDYHYYVIDYHMCLVVQGSYGRLGLGTSDSQTTLMDIDTFPGSPMIKKLANSKGSDGHSLAIDLNGEVYSWGDG